MTASNRSTRLLLSVVMVLWTVQLGVAQQTTAGQVVTGDYASLLRDAAKAYQEGNLSAAESGAAACISKDSARYEAHLLLATIALEQGNLDRARNIADRMKAIAPASVLDNLRSAIAQAAKAKAPASGDKQAVSPQHDDRANKAVVYLERINAQHGPDESLAALVTLFRENRTIAPPTRLDLHAMTKHTASLDAALKTGDKQAADAASKSLLPIMADATAKWPLELTLWSVRARASLAANDIEVGWLCWHAMIALGGDNSTDETVLDTLVALKDAKWNVATLRGVETPKVKAAALSSKLIGNWNYSSSDRTRERILPNFKSNMFYDDSISINLTIAANGAEPYLRIHAGRHTTWKEREQYEDNGHYRYRFIDKSKASRQYLDTRQRHWATAQRASDGSWAENPTPMAFSHCDRSAEGFVAFHLRIDGDMAKKLKFRRDDGLVVTSAGIADAIAIVFVPEGAQELGLIRLDGNQDLFERICRMNRAELLQQYGMHTNIVWLRR